MKKISIMLVIIFCTVCFLTSSVYAAGSVGITASKTTVTVGDTFTVSLKYSGATYGGIGGNIYITEGGVASYQSSSGSATYNSANNFVAATFVSGSNSGTAITLTYKAVKAGKVTFSFSPSEIIDSEGNDVSVSTYSATITVKEKEVTPTQPTTPTVTKSSNAYLSSLKLGVEGMSPSFNKNTTSYSINVPNSVTSINVYASCEHSKAWYSVSGNTNLKEGTNYIKVKVTAENYSTKTYTITVTRADDVSKSNASLKNVTFDNATLVESFRPDVYDYTLANLKDVEKIVVNTFPENTKATVTVVGNDNLFVGTNQIVITVLATDNVTSRNYTFTFDYDKTPEVIPEPVVDSTVDSNAYIKTNNANSILNRIWQLCKENAMLILVYLFALVELFQIIVLYKKLEEMQTINTQPRRKRASEDTENKEERNEE